jgi:hypothetical protein
MYLRVFSKGLAISILFSSTLGCNILTTIITTPTPTSIPTPTPVPVIVYSDDFLNSQTGWPINDTVEFTNGYVNERYRVTAAQLSFDIIAFGISYQTFGDGVLSVDVQCVEGDSLQTDATVLWRIQDTLNYYALFLSNNSHFSVQKIINGDWEELVHSTHHSSLLADNATNHIDIAVIGTESTIYIYGALAKTITDSSFTSGDIGLGAHSNPSSPATAEFDNLRLCDINTWSPPSVP